MPPRVSAILPSLCLTVLALSGASSALAQEASPSLYEKRLGIIKGTSKGIVVWGPGTSETPAVVTSIDGKEVSSAPKQSSATAPEATVTATSRPWNALPPPSGRSMAEAQRLGAVGGGIPLPTARRGSPAESDPTAKP